MTSSLLQPARMRETRNLLAEVSHLCSLLVRLPAPPAVREARAQAAVACARTTLALEDAILHARDEESIDRAAAEAFVAAAAALEAIEASLREARENLPHPQP